MYRSSISYADVISVIPQGHCVLEMPSGTGKTVSLLSLIVSYQQVSQDLDHSHPGHAVV
jgi:Rad3-related DNA helicase